MCIRDSKYSSRARAEAEGLGITFAKGDFAGNTPGCGDREGLPPISTWNTSKVTDFSKLFMRQKGFNDDISAWDTSSVTTMRLMCSGASSFNQPLSDWRVDNVTNMSGMFECASSFNQPLNDWRVDNVTDMYLSLIHI